MKKLIWITLIHIILLGFGCNQKVSNDRPASGKFLKKEKVPLENPKGEISPSKQSDKKNKEKHIHGVKRIQNFKMYSQVLGNGEGYYLGRPKIEILNNEGEVVKEINVLKASTLFKENLEFKFREDLGENYFNVVFENSNDALKYNNSKLFPSPPVPTTILFEITYKVENDVLFCQYTYFSMIDMDIYGGGCEVILIDTLGNEISRVEGPGIASSMGITRDKKFFYLTTGGQINEDAYYPTVFTVFNLDLNKIVFSLEAQGTESVGGDTNGNKGIMKIFKNRQEDRFDFEIMVFDHISNMIYFSKNPSICKENRKGLGTKENYCYCTTDDKVVHKFYYKKDFSSKVFTQK